MACVAKYAFKAKMVDPKFDLAKARAYSSKGAGPALPTTLATDVLPTTSATEAVDIFGEFEPDSVETGLGESSLRASKRNEGKRRMTSEHDMSMMSDANSGKKYFVYRHSSHIFQQELF